MSNSKTSSSKTSEIKPAVTPHDSDKLSPEQLGDNAASGSDKPVAPPPGANQPDTPETKAATAAAEKAKAEAAKDGDAATATAKTTAAKESSAKESTAKTSAAKESADKPQTAEQPNALDSSKEDVKKNPSLVKPDPANTKPLQTETAEDKAKPLDIDGVGPVPEIQNAIAEESRKADEEAVKNLTADETTDRIVMHLVNEINSTMPAARGDLDDKEFEKIVRSEVEKVSAPRIEDRSTDAMIISRIKTDVKTRIGEAVKQSTNKAGTKRLRDARIDVEAASLSPMPLSPESLMEVAKAEPKIDTKAKQKAVDAEIQRLENQRTGQMSTAKDMQEERTYFLQEPLTAEQLAENPGMRPNQFVGKLTEKPTSNTLTLAVYQDGKETGRIKEVNFEEYNVREVDRNQANDLSRA
ncbi:MAG TPA: hypothetical protein VNI84_20480 [Pyrinomonadaceae bacterium]|nr:hypothetical protein [Pyrinomonadaceae bacterium]